MSAPQVSFARQLGAALVVSLSAAAVHAALAPWLGAGSALRVAIAIAGLAYVLYVVASSGRRVGRVTTLACWTLAAASTAALDLPLAAYALVHVGLVWIVRSLYRYAGLTPALADLGVSLLGAAFAAWAAQRSGSAWLAFWCFFLVQAFHALIPPTLTGGARTPDAVDDAFARAHRTAESAARRLSGAAR